MHIDSIRLFRVPLETPGDGADPGARFEAVHACLRSGAQVGVGEATLAVAPTVCEEWSAGAFACLREWLAPAIVGRSIDTGEALQEALAPYHGNRAAKSALDVAWWSLAASTRGVSLDRMLGGTRTSIPLSRTLDVMDSIDALLAAIGESLAAGYDHVTLKLRPGWDVEMLRAVRQTYSAEPIAVDCDGGCTLGQQEMFFRMEDFFLHYIEQPLPADDLVGHAMLQESLRTPISLDQSVTSLARLEQAIDLGSCRMVRIDPAQVGGITPALAIHKTCQAAAIPCAVGGGPHGGIAATAAAAVAGVCGGALPAESFAWRAQPWLLAGGTTRPARNADGKLQIDLIDESFGLGLRIDERMALESASEQALVD